DDAEAGGKFCYLVAVAHPHLMLFADFPQAVEQDAAFRNLDKRAAKFTALAAFDLTAQLRGQHLLAIANAKHGNTGIQKRLRDARAAFFGDAGGAAGKDDSLGLQTLKRLLGIVERGDL